MPKSIINNEKFNIINKKKLYNKEKFKLRKLKNFLEVNKIKDIREKIKIENKKQTSYLIKINKTKSDKKIISNSSYNLATIFHYKTANLDKDDDSLAIGYYKRAYEYGSIESIYMLGIIYMDNKMYKKSLNYFNKIPDNNIISNFKEVVLYKLVLYYKLEIKKDMSNRSIINLQNLINKMENLNYDKYKINFAKILLNFLKKDFLSIIELLIDNTKNSNLDYTINYYNKIFNLEQEIRISKILLFCWKNNKEETIEKLSFIKNKNKLNRKNNIDLINLLENKLNL